MKRSSSTPASRHRAFVAQTSSRHLPWRPKRAFDRPVIPASRDPRDVTMGLLYDGVTLHTDRVCKCGFTQCSQRGPCAPVSAPKAEVPKPAPAERFVVGQRVRVIGNESIPTNARSIRLKHYIAIGTIVRVASVGSASGAVGVVTDSGFPQSVATDDLEPLPAEPCAESEWTLERAGFTRTGETAKGCAMWRRDGASAVFVGESYDSARGWYAKGDGEASVYGSSPALAACAALGIEIACDDDIWLAWFGGNAYDTGATADAESCARAALEAHAKGGAS